MVIAQSYQGQITENPTGIAIAEALSNHRLTQAWFTRLISARQKDIFQGQPQTLAELEQYCEETSSSLLYLTLEILGLRNADADHAASHLGQAQGLVTILRALPFHAKSGSIYLPVELTAQHGISTEALMRGTHDATKLADVVYEVANRANNHLAWAREYKSKVPKEAIPAFMTSPFVEDYLLNLEKENFDLFSSRLQPYGFRPRFKAVRNYYGSTF